MFSEMDDNEKREIVECWDVIIDMFNTHPSDYIVSQYFVEDESVFTCLKDCTLT